MVDGIRVLYVDDEPSLLEVAQVFLEQDGEFCVETAPSARIALDSLSIPSYDVIISDYQMPGMDGIAFLKAVREQYGDLPFILFTGRGREEIVIQAINNGVDFYLQKGGDVGSQFAELALKIRKAVSRKRTEIALRESEKRLRLLIREAPEALAMFDKEMRYIVASRRWIADYHLGDREILGHSHYEIFPEIPEELKIIHRRGLAGEVVSNDEDKFVRANGDVQWLAWEVRPWYETGTVVGGITIFSQDITTRMIAEEALRESEEKFRSIVETSPDLIWETDIGGNFLYMSPTVQTILGYFPEEVLGKSIIDLVPEEAREVAKEKFSQMIASEGSLSPIEIPARHRNGTGILLEIRPARLTDADGMLTGLRGVTVDITERKRSEQAFQTIVHGMVGTTGINALEVIAESVSSWLGADCVMVGEIQPDNQTVNVLSMQLDGKAVWDFTYSLKGTPCENVAEKGFCHYPDDAIRLFPQSRDLVELNIRGYIGTPLKNSDGKVIGILCALFRNPFESSPAIRDIMAIIAVKAGAEIERSQIERALRESEEKFRTFVENADDIIFSITTEGIFRYISPRLTDTLGYDTREMIGRSFESLIPPEDHAAAREFLRGILAGSKEKTSIELPVPHRDGTQTWHSITLSPIHGTGGAVEYLLGVARDTTRRRRDMEALRQANKKLNLLSGITRHDIKNQLLTLNGFASILHKKISDPACETYFSHILKASSQITNMIQFTKEYEQIGVHAPTWQDVHDLVNTAARDVAPDQLILKNDLPEHSEVFADPLIARVIFNLIDNAVRHGGKITTVRFSLEKRNGDWIIVCEDDGSGVPREEKEIIFDLGYGKNTGFGLTLSREILGITGITIKETGEPGKGARFELTVPRNQYKPAP